MRGLLGSPLTEFPREPSETIKDIAGEISIGNKRFNIVRPFTTTQTAKVDIAGENETLRLPALKATSSKDLTYGRWLLKKLALPVLPKSRLGPKMLNQAYIHIGWLQRIVDILKKKLPVSFTTGSFSYQ